MCKMATPLTVNCMRILSTAGRCTSFQPVRFRWKPPNKDEEVLPSFAERMSELKAAEIRPASEGVDIGYHYTNSTNSSTKLVKLRKWVKSRPKLEPLARHQKLQVNLDEMKNEWSEESRPHHVSRVAKHYGIFDDMFDGAHFYPTVDLSVAFDYDEEFVTPVHYGNIIPAKEVAIQPGIHYESDDDSLWTLLFTSPDGNLQSNEKELLHWLVCNIPSNQVDKGDVLCDYLQPFPPKGTGYLRYIFVLFKQTRSLDLNHLKHSSGRVRLADRDFSTLQFYQENELDLTPAGLTFFQSQWDESIKQVFHNVLNMPEPTFEFIHPPAYVPEQVDFPHKMPFNLYLDRYRDIKDIQEEVLKEKLKKADPFSAPAPRPKYVNTEKLPPSMPSWMKLKIQSMRLGKNQWKDLYEDK